VCVGQIKFGQMTVYTDRSYVLRRFRFHALSLMKLPRKWHHKREYLFLFEVLVYLTCVNHYIGLHDNEMQMHP
jgi:hypothetical protein